MQNQQMLVLKYVEELLLTNMTFIIDLKEYGFLKKYLIAFNNYLKNNIH